MDTLFLKNNRVIKLQLLELLTSGELDLVLTAKELRISLMTLKRYLNELQNDLEEIGCQVTLSYNELGSCCIKNKELNYAVSPIGELRIFYAEDSTAFQICNILCKKNTVPLRFFEETLFISSSQIYKVIKEVNVKLRSWNIEVGKESNGNIQFLGREIDIRIFLYNFASQFTVSHTLLFGSVSRYQILKDIKAFLPIKEYSSFTIDKLCVFFGVLQSRLLSKNLIHSVDPGLYRTLEFFSYIPFEKIQSFFIDKRVFNTQDQYTEYLYLNIFLRIYLSDVIREEDPLRIGRYLSCSKNEDHLFFNELFHFWKDNFSISITEENYYVVLYNSALLSTLIVHLDIKVNNLWHLDEIHSFQYPTVNTKLIDQIARCFSTFLTLSTLSENKIDAIRHHIFPYLISYYYLNSEMFKQPKLNIYLYFTYDYTSYEFVKNKIEMIYNNSVINFTNCPDSADVIVTDSAENFSIPKKVIVVSDILDVKKTNDIVNVITTTLTGMMN